MNRDHSVVFEIASKYCISDSFVDHDVYSISSKGFLPTVVDIIMVIWVKFTHSSPDCRRSLLPSLFDHYQFALFHGPNISGSYAILLFTALSFTSYYCFFYIPRGLIFFFDWYNSLIMVSLCWENFNDCFILTIFPEIALFCKTFGPCREMRCMSQGNKRKTN